MVIKSKRKMIKKHTGKINSVKTGKEYKYKRNETKYQSTDKVLYMYEIWEEGKEEQHKFDFALMVMDNGKDLKVTDCYAHGYKGEGIAATMILEAKQSFNKRIVSSSNKKKSVSGESRWEDATILWEKLVERKLAKYDEENDIFYTVM